MVYSDRPEKDEYIAMREANVSHEDASKQLGLKRTTAKSYGDQYLASKTKQPHWFMEGFQNYGGIATLIILIIVLIMLAIVMNNQNQQFRLDEERQKELVSTQDKKDKIIAEQRDELTKKDELLKQKDEEIAKTKEEVKRRDNVMINSIPSTLNIPKGN